MNLIDLTGRESGIIVYGDNTVAVVSWTTYDDDQFPVLSPFGTMIPFPVESGTFEAADATFRLVEDVRSEIPGSIWLTGEKDDDGMEIADTDLTILEDENNDLIRLFLGREANGTPLGPEDYKGWVHTLPDGVKILTLDMWI